MRIRNKLKYYSQQSIIFSFSQNLLLEKTYAHTWGKLVNVEISRIKSRSCNEDIYKNIC